MKIVKLNASAEGYYSGQTYNETLYISEKLYKKIEEEIKDLKVFIYDLDGKHSEVECYIYIDTLLDETVLLEENDGNSLYEELADICHIGDFDFNKDIDTVITYLKENDLLSKKFSFEIKLSQYPKLLEYVEKLNS